MHWAIAVAGLTVGILPPADLCRREILVVDHVVLTALATQATWPAEDVGAVGIDVADSVRIQGGLMAQARLRHPRPQHGEHVAVIPTDRVLREPVDPERGAYEGSSLHQHLQRMLPHTLLAAAQQLLPRLSLF